MYNTYLTNFVSKREGPGIKQLKHITRELEEIKIYRRGNDETKRKFLVKHKIRFFKQNIEYFAKDPDRISSSIVAIFIGILKETAFRNEEHRSYMKIVEGNFREFEVALENWLSENAPNKKKNLQEAAQNAPAPSIFGTDPSALWQNNFPSKKDLLIEFEKFLYYIFYEWVLSDVYNLLPHRKAGTTAPSSSSHPPANVC